MLIAREKGKDIITYVGFYQFCHVIKCFPDLKKTFGKEDITSPLLSSSRVIEWRKKHMSQLEQYVD